MDDAIDIGSGLTIPLDKVEVRTSRSSGPGGQHANVTASRVEATVVISSLDLPDAVRTRLIAKLGDRVTAVAQDTRSQLRNRELATERLANRIAAAMVVPKVRRASRPTRASVERRRSAKQARSAVKRDRRRPADD